MSVIQKRQHRDVVARGRYRLWAVLLAAALVSSVLQGTVLAPRSVAAPVGQGFNLNASDLRFILKQIKISEQHAATLTASNPCGTLLGSGPDQIPAGGVGVTLPWGLRTVDGSCNNIELPEKRTFGTADQPFPRMVPKKLRAAENGTTYAQTSGTVRDSQPRLISNLVVDQTGTNPAAVKAAGGVPEGQAAGDPLFIPNVAPDTGLSAPYNSWFTLFGQFFDHGLDLVNKGGNGVVLIPLQPDDPQFTPGSPTNFMALTRATHGGDHEAVNQTSPFVDQSQTYSSHPSHQVFLREYRATPDGPVATGGLITGPGGGMATWTDVREQARTVLGIELSDLDVLSVPLLRTDPYGRFLRGPNGYPQLVVPSAPGGLVEGDPDTPVTTAGATSSGHAFLDDIAHHATPAANLTADDDPGTGDDGLPGTYDDEMLGAHFIAGDGRVNENIGLTAVHHVFHSEHNRLAAEIDAMLDDPALFTDAERADWRTTTRPAGWDYGERLFQASRFVTEMEYQHLAFEEFIRKVQPGVNPFGEGGTGYHTTINPAIKAEFAHAVYRFGHSMLNESVDRVSATGAEDDISLLNAFLNPPSFMADGRTPEQAAGDIVRGMTRQTGNELDEFVTEALRNDLLGLPLDLATLNMARARDTGTPSLNEARRAFYAESDNPALVPYTSWADLGFSLKHAESLPNFIAAYGTHPSITAATTLDDKRAAAYALLYGVRGLDGEIGTADDIAEESVPADRAAFINSAPHTVPDETTGEPTVVHDQWTLPESGVTTTGVDRIDLWVGGLAEKQMVFGGLLGPTFNYVFEGQTEALQDGDRFYYLSRTAGLNLLTQLEGNSFAELIQRNTDVEGLPADAFSRPDLVFDVAALGTTGPILDDPATPDYDESRLLVREANGTIRYGGAAHVVFNGSAGNNLIRSSEGDDTIRGNDGNDRMEGGDGADHLIGGLGDDILTDLFGDDVLKGGDGNDTLSSGQGFGGDLNQGGRGDDMIIGGNDATESFAGPGDDLVFAGDGEDTVFGDDGDDWIEGGLGPFSLLQGDNGAPFQDDPNEAGHDVIIGYGGEQDYDAEGGDDIMLAGPGIQRAEGMLGFDFVTHKLDPVAADSDMAISVLLPPSVETNRDRFDLVEALSGWDKNDVLRGDDRVDNDMVGHELTAAGVDRIAGLASILPGDGTSFTGGNILLGGAGADLIEGRGGDDLIDGDAWLDVQLRAPDPATADTTDTRLHDGLTTLRADTLAGRVNPGTVDIVRTVRTGTAATDTALFTGPRADYTITTADGVTTVVDNVGTDGTDTLRNIEQLRFSDRTIATPTQATAPEAPVIGTATAGNASATVTWTAPSDGGSPITQYRVQVRTGTTVVRTDVVTAPASSATIAGLTNGTAYTFRVRAVNAVGVGPLSAASNAVTPAAVPAAPVIGTATAGNASAVVRWTPPASNGGSPVTEYRVQVRTGTTVVRTVTGVAATATSTTITGLTNGTAYTFRVRAVNAIGVGPFSAASNVVRPATVPTAPVIGTATAGAAGGAVTATAAWTPPTNNGGSPITGYRVRALRMAADGSVLSTTTSAVQPATTRSLAMTLAAGNYRFTVQAINAIGAGPQSGRSNQVQAR
ncbi:peroxidase family protein [Serinicoccus chungangensis]|uniref:peroxidase family protein n=1 Tax=Serinicoccus chungangensis TaxID=767452 RepID=UPI001118F657|nr:peroxidase family protein [Serinicoccus chungangensis]